MSYSQINSLAKPVKDKNNQDDKNNYRHCGWCCWRCLQGLGIKASTLHISRGLWHKVQGHFRDKKT
jgi:hypothetical protein